MQVLVLYAGNHNLVSGQDSEKIKQTLQSYLELQLVAKVEIVLLPYPSGANGTLELAPSIGKQIMDHYAEYDGFVVVHSVDNVIYTSNLLAFQLTNLGKPVIFTGTNLPEDFFDLPAHFSEEEQSMYREMSLRTSLVTAVQLATLNCSGVILAYGPKIIRAVRAIEHPVSDQAGFTSLTEADVATVHFGIDIQANAPKRHDQTPNFTPNYDSTVAWLPHQPDFQLPILPKPPVAYLLSAYQESPLPDALMKESKVPVVILGGNRSKRNLPKHIIAIPGLPIITAHTKLMVGTGLFKTTAELRDFMLNNIAGEYKPL